MSRHEAFTFLCSLLNPFSGDNAQEQLSQDLRAPSFTWEELVVVASEQRVSAMLKMALDRHNLTAFLPRDLVEYFEGVEELNGQRNAQIYDQCIRVATILNGIGVSPVFLKGSGCLLADLFESRAHRVMLDIDLLVPHELLFDCVAALKAAGYDEHEHDLIADPRSHHYPPMFHSAGIVEIELHSEVIAFPNGELLAAEDVISSAHEVVKDNAKFKIPSAEHRIVHVTAHAQVTDQNYVHGFFVLRQFLECLVLVKNSDAPIKWLEIENRFKRVGKPLAYACQIVSLNDLFGVDFPLPTKSATMAKLFHKRALFQIEFPRMSTRLSRLIRPVTLLYRSLNDRILTRRLFANMFKPAWIKRHWQRLLGK